MDFKPTPCPKKTSMAGTSPPLSGSGFDRVPASLRVASFTPLASSPDLFRRSTCSWVAEEHVDDRDKPGHDEVERCLL